MYLAFIVRYRIRTRPFDRINNWKLKSYTLISWSHIVKILVVLAVFICTSISEQKTERLGVTSRLCLTRSRIANWLYLLYSICCFRFRIVFNAFAIDWFWDFDYWLVTYNHTVFESWSNILGRLRWRQRPALMWTRIPPLLRCPFYTLVVLFCRPWSSAS